ncbi:LOG family protein, partial [Acinetobacter pseudolwoffii]
MQSVIQMTDYFKDNSPKTTRPLVALYCGSRAGNKPIYLEKAIQLSQGLAEHGFGLVYGGASIGLMGQVADAMI